MRLHYALPLLTLALVACNGSGTTGDDVSSSAPPDTISSTPTAMTDSSLPNPGSGDWDGKLLSGKQTVTLKTSKGNITLELNADAAPRTVTNFVTLAKSGFYNGLTFHRVIPGFMIQGGDPNGNGTGGASIFGATFEDEIEPNGALYQTGYKAGVIAMANRGPDTNGSQFFIMDKDYPLPPNYTIFGKVTEGQSVVNAIANTPRNPANDMPKEAVTYQVEVK